MSPLVDKLAPTAIVVALAAWCCWPYVSGRGADTFVEEPGDLPQIAGSLLSPEIAPASERNPFQALKPEPADLVQVDSPPIEEPKTAEVEPPPKRPISDVLSSLALDATFIHGSRRIALIDGRLYGQGDALAVSDPVATPCIVAQIFPHKVVIRHEDETVELTYRDPASTTGSSELVEVSGQAHPESNKIGAPASDAL